MYSMTLMDIFGDIQVDHNSYTPITLHVARLEEWQSGH